MKEVSPNIRFCSSVEKAKVVDSGQVLELKAHRLSQSTETNWLPRNGFWPSFLSLALLLISWLCAADGFAAVGTHSCQQTSGKAEHNSSQKELATADEAGSAAQQELEKALQEFRVQAERVSSTAGTANGKSSRPKTRDYRGNLYEYLRNDALDALPHQVRQASGSKSVLRRNQFGFNLTGPVRIPWLYHSRDNTFFSATYEGTREKIARPYLANIPTVPQRGGDFSDLVDNAGEPVVIYDPLTTRPNPDFNPVQPVSATNLQYLRDPFPGNRIPLDRMDLIAMRTLSYYPQPNTNVGPFLRNNFFVNAAETNTPNGTVWKLDHNFGTRHKLTWNGRWSSGLDGAAPIFENAANPGAPRRHVRSRSASFSETFNISPTLVNQFSLSASYSALAPDMTVIDPSADYARDLGFSGVQRGAFPRFDLGQYVDIGSQPGSLIRYQIASYTLSDGLSVRFRKHNLKLSFYTSRGQVHSFRPRNPAGRFTFNGKLTSLPGINNTGDPFAQFLLGLSNRAEQSIVVHPSYFRAEQYQLTASDEYQMTPNFNATFSLGLQIDTPRREKYDRQSSLDLGLINPTNSRPGALVFAGRDGRPGTFAPSQANWEPAIGWAWNPGGSRRTVIRGGFSLSYSTFPLYPTEFGTLGFNASPLLVSTNDQLAPVVNLQTGFPASFVPPPDLRPEAANDLRAEYFEPEGILPYDQNWRLEIERDLPADFVIRLSYLGEKGVHQYTGDGIDLNPLDPVYLSFRDRLNDLAFNQSLRPYPQFRSISPGYGYPIGSNSLHRGQLRVEKKFSHGLNFSSSYFFSKLIDDVLGGANPQNNLDLKSEKSISPNDVAHQFSVNYLYELPFGEGRAFLNQSGWIENLIGGWSLSGVTSLRTGTPIVLRALFNNTGGVTQDLRVNLVPGVDPRVENPSASQWFNAAAFIQPSDFTLGDGPRTHPSLRNPGFQNFDMSLTKRVPVTDEWTLELIMEAFNALNYGNLNLPDRMIGSVADPNLNAGKIVGTSGGRVVQLGLRFSF
ncbi:MAG: hypothetical protein L0338_33055 [Acidobacteria bacterium]|nr:hypothetical protein [Acidobacteriota bacterium]